MATVTGARSLDVDTDRVEMFARHEVFMQENAAEEGIFRASAEKLKILSIYAFASISAATAATIIGAGLCGYTIVLGIPSAVVLLISSSFAVYVAQDQLDFQNLEKLAGYREAILDRFHDLKLQQNFDEVDLSEEDAHLIQQAASKYGWSQVFYYMVIKPGDFESIFNFQIARLSVEDALAFHELIQSKYDAYLATYPENPAVYRIPHPSVHRDALREKIFTDDEKLQKTHLKHLDFDKLLAYGILTDAEHRIFVDIQTNYKRIKTEYRDSIKDRRNGYLDAIAPELTAFEMAKKEALHNFETSSCHKKLKQLRFDQLREERSVRYAIEYNPEVQRLKNDWIHLKNGVTQNGEFAMDTLDPRIQGLINRSRQLYLDAKSEIEAREEPQMAEISARFQRRRMEYSEGKRAAIDERDRMLAAAKESFEDETRREFTEYCALIAPQKRAYTAAITALLARYPTV